MKKNQKRNMQLVGLYASVGLSSLIQLSKNIKLAYTHQNGELIIFVPTLFVLVAITLLIVLSKINKLHLSPSSEKIFHSFELILSTIAVVCCCFIDSNGSIVKIGNLSAHHIAGCIYTTIGIYGCMIVSYVLSDGIEHELERERRDRRIIEYRKFKSNRMRRIRNKISKTINIASQ